MRAYAPTFVAGIPDLNLKGSIAGRFANRCLFLPASIGSVACISRFHSPSTLSGGAMVGCTGTERFAQAYIQTVIQHWCLYTTFTYWWRISGYGYVTAFNGQFFVSQSNTSALVPAKCL